VSDLPKKVPKKLSCAEVRRRYKDLLHHNSQLGVFCEDLIKVVKMVHKLSAKQHDAMHLLISPSARKAREVLACICQALGPYCVEVSPEARAKGAVSELIKDGPELKVDDLTAEETENDN